LNREVRVEALSIRSDPARIRDVRSWIGTIARSAGFSEGETHDLAVALSEVCSNSYRHSYSGRTDGRIDLEAELENGQLRLTVRDYGTPFDASEHGEPHPAELSEGGYGLFLIRRLTDEVKYTKMGVGTRVVLVKHRRQERV
jgi:serine/threonine-protein kinase RsbW